MSLKVVIEWYGMVIRTEKLQNESFELLWFVNIFIASKLFVFEIEITFFH